MLELYDKDFNEASINILQKSNMNSLETKKWKISSGQWKLRKEPNTDYRNEEKS